MNRILGIIGGVVFGAIVWGIGRLLTDFGLTILPFSSLALDLLPGIILGGVAGYFYHKKFNTFWDRILSGWW